MVKCCNFFPSILLRKRLKNNPIIYGVVKPGINIVWNIFQFECALCYILHHLKVHVLQSTKTTSFVRGFHNRFEVADNVIK